MDPRQLPNSEKKRKITPLRRSRSFKVTDFGRLPMVVIDEFQVTLRRLNVRLITNNSNRSSESVVGQTDGGQCLTLGSARRGV